MTDSFEITKQRYEIEKEQKWRDEIDVIPHIQFPTEWAIQVIPPFGDAVVRFRVRLPSGKDRSIYLDRRNSLGYWSDIDSAYWEVYPYQGDVGRCYMNDTKTLLEMIGDESEGEG
jgi:hypothetical protein